MAYGDFIGLHRRTFADKELRDKVFNIANDSKWDRHWRGLASMVLVVVLKIKGFLIKD